MKSIPTKYGGAKFRSRLEARWAAFFDLCAWDWTYEPVDLEGWVPDFAIFTKMATVYSEVKPVLVDDGPIDLEFEKAERHSGAVPVLLCGVRPSVVPSVGRLLTPNHIDREHLHSHLFVRQIDRLWNEAGTATQWAPRAVIAPAPSADPTSHSAHIPLLTLGERQELIRAAEDYEMGGAAVYNAVRVEMRSISKQRILDLFRYGKAGRKETANLIAKFDLGSA